MYTTTLYIFILYTLMTKNIIKRHTRHPPPKSAIAGLSSSKSEFMFAFNLFVCIPLWKVNQVNSNIGRNLRFIIKLKPTRKRAPSFIASTHRSLWRMVVLMMMMNIHCEEANDADSLWFIHRTQMLGSF